MDNAPEVRCRLVAQELGYGERLDAQTAGTPSLTVMKLSSAASEKDYDVTLLDDKCAFLYGERCRNIVLDIV